MSRYSLNAFSSWASENASSATAVWRVRVFLRDRCIPFGSKTHISSGLERQTARHGITARFTSMSSHATKRSPFRRRVAFTSAHCWRASLDVQITDNDICGGTRPGKQSPFAMSTVFRNAVSCRKPAEDSSPHTSYISDTGAGAKFFKSGMSAS